MVTKSKRKSPKGVATTDLVFSVEQGTNAQLFPKVLALYVKPGSRIADTTYGTGVFWRNVTEDAYHVYVSDLAAGIDACELPYGDASMDCVVFDPPYMHSDGGGAHMGTELDTYYRNDARAQTELQSGALRGHDAVVDLYVRAAKEAWRVLRSGGIYLIKCQDEVHARKQRLTHVELINAYEGLGYVMEDLFVLVRDGHPGVSRMVRQQHARKRHSYLLVARKPWYRRLPK